MAEWIKWDRYNITINGYVVPVPLYPFIRRELLYLKNKKAMVYMTFLRDIKLTG